MVLAGSLENGRETCGAATVWSSIRKRRGDRSVSRRPIGVTSAHVPLDLLLCISTSRCISKEMSFARHFGRNTTTHYILATVLGVSSGFSLFDAPLRQHYAAQKQLLETAEATTAAAASVPDGGGNSGGTS